MKIERDRSTGLFYISMKVRDRIVLSLREASSAGQAISDVLTEYKKYFNAKNY